MTSRPTAAALPQLRRLLSRTGLPSDSQLLERFLTCRDEAAFAALVRRHGPMVLAVCRRLLPDPNDADDAFQATFLVLVRKASSVGRPERLGNWLYGVAYRTALKARGHNARRRRFEQPLADFAADGGVAELVWRELRPVLDEELHRLPEKYRAPVVLCYLEGVSKREAARQLGWPEGTLSTRLHQARELLRGRLTRRGLGLSAVAVAVALSQGAAPAAVPPALTAVAVAAVSHAAAPAPIAALAEGVLRAMWWKKLKVVAAMLLAAGLLAAGVGGAALRTGAAAPEAEGQAPPAAPAAEAPKKGETEPKVLRLDKGVGQVVWSPDGKLMASRATRSEKREGGEDAFDRDWFSTVKVWDAATGKEIVSLGEVKNTGLVAFGFSPDGTTLALSFRRTIPEGDKVELWDARKGELKKTIEMDYGRIIPKFAFSPDGKVLAVLYAGDKGRDATKDDLNGGVRLFDLATGEVIRSVRGHKHMAVSLAFSPDGKLLATGGSQHDNDVRLWEVATGKEVRTLDAGAIVPALAFSPDGKALASGQGDGRVVLWDVATGKERRSFKDLFDYADLLTFGPDGLFLAGSGVVEKDKKQTRVTKLWDVQTGQFVKAWQDTDSGVAFAPAGGTLSVLGKEGVVWLWELLPKKEAVMPPDAADADAFGFKTLIDELLKEKKTDDQVAEALILATLGRFPQEQERKFLIDHLTKKKDRRDAMVDAVWALINTKEYWAHLDALNSHDQRKILKK
jgi:RNA polymerase sigma factor (sigma-70 family)